VTRLCIDCQTSAPDSPVVSEQPAERHQPPVARLDAGGADPFVPDLAGALVRRLGLGGASVALDGALEDHQLVPFLDVGGGGGAAAIALLQGVDRATWRW
jgi:hypothetical protein